MMSILPASSGPSADLAEPTFEPTRLSCNADGSLVVEAHPVWAQNAIAGGGFRVRRGGHTIVTGAIPMEQEEYDSSLQWWQALCRPP
jgi:hypothetical protein